MKASAAIVISLTVTASRVLAAGGVSEGGRSGLMTECLIALLVMIFVFQFVPGIALLVESVRGIFARGKENVQSRPAGKA